MSVADDCAAALRIVQKVEKERKAMPTGGPSNDAMRKANAANASALLAQRIGPEWRQGHHVGTWAHVSSGGIFISYFPTNRRKSIRPSSAFNTHLKKRSLERAEAREKTKKYIVKGFVYENFTIEVEAGSLEHAQKVAKEHMAAKNPGKTVAVGKAQVSTTVMVDTILE